MPLDSGVAPLRVTVCADTNDIDAADDIDGTGGAADTVIRALRAAEDVDLVPATDAPDIVVCPAPGDPGLPLAIVATPAALFAPLTVGAADLGAANRVLTLLTRAATAASWPADVRLAAPTRPRVGIGRSAPQHLAAALAPAGADLVALGAGEETAALTGSAELDAVVVAGTPSDTGECCAITIAAVADRATLTVLARSYDDAVVWDIAATITAQPAIGPIWPATGADAVELVVFGAHLRGGPLSHQLTDLGARWAGELTTAPRYRMTVLPTHPAKPAVTRVTAGEPGAALLGHRWLMSAAALGRFLAALPPPMQLGKVEFDDGTWRTAFACDASAATGPDVSEYGSWPAAVAAGATDPLSGEIPAAL